MRSSPGQVPGLGAHAPAGKMGVDSSRSRSESPPSTFFSVGTRWEPSEVAGMGLGSPNVTDGSHSSPSPPGQPSSFPSSSASTFPFLDWTPTPKNGADPARTRNQDFSLKAWMEGTL